MDYEKKYKEAVEKIRNLFDEGEENGYTIVTYKKTFEDIIPELKESEDEKTRKRIIALVNAHGQGMYKDDMLAWLENIPYTIDHEKREGFHLGYKVGLEKQGEKSLTVDIDSMVEAYEQRLINQGNGVRNSPIVNMCVAAFKHGVENTLDELHLRQGEQNNEDKIEALRTEYEKGRADVIADTLSWLENCWPRYCSNQTIIEGFKEAIKGE